MQAVESHLITLLLLTQQTVVEIQWRAIVIVWRKPCCSGFAVTVQALEEEAAVL